MATIDGTPGNDTLVGTPGDDVLNGLEGDDVLEGGAGADQLNGGDGSNDVASYQNSDGGVTIDLANGLANGGDAEGDTLFGIESVVGSATGDNWLIGDGAANVLRGGGFSDILDGGAGDDELEGGAGVNQLLGGAGTDTASYRHSAWGVNVDLGIGLAVAAPSDGPTDQYDQLTSIESVVGSAFSDTLIGDAGDNRLDGLDGNDRLVGGAGADTLIGGDGDDWLDGGADADTLIGGADSPSGPGIQFLGDVVDYATSNAGVTVNLQDGTGFGGDAEGDLLSGIEIINGSSYNDTLIAGDFLIDNDGFFALYGNDGDDRLEGRGGINLLDGGAGVDTLLGGTGSDSLYTGGGDALVDGGAGFDFAVVSVQAAVADITFSVAANLDGGYQELPDGTRIQNVEYIHFTAGSGNDTIVGGAFYDTILGGDGNDALSGGAADDVLTGGAGNDVLNGDDDFAATGGGGDRLTGGAGNDMVDGGLGDNDWAYFSFGRGEYSLTYTDSDSVVVTDLRPGSPDGTDTLTNVEYMLILDSASGTYEKVRIGAKPVLDVNTVDEGSTLGTVIGTVSSAPQHPGDTLTYTLLDDAAGRFRIDPGTGVLTVLDGTLLNYEAAQTHAISVQVLDESSGVVLDRSFTIQVNDVAEAPVIGSNGGGASASIDVAETPENSTAVTTVTAVSASDPDAGSVLTYSIVGGADGALFRIDSQTGALSLASASNFEVPTDANHDNRYDVTVAASDQTGLADMQDIAVTITNVNEAPRITSSGGAEAASVHMTENLTVATVVEAFDPDASPAPHYSIAGGADGGANGAFTIDPTTGILSFIAVPNFEAPTDANHDNTYEVVVKASDPGGLFATQTISVVVDDINDAAPVIGSNGGADTAVINNFAEGSQLVTTVAATDLDSATLHYSIVGGDDAARFVIEPTFGYLSFNPIALPDFEAPADVNHDNVYQVIVQASDGGLIDTQTISVNVTNVNEAPAITSNGGGASASINFAENSTAAVTTVAAIDPDAGTALRYSIISTGDAGKFTINASTGALSFVSPPDFETPGDIGTDNIYNVTVQASDGLLADTQAISVTVTNVVETTTTIRGTGGNDVLTGTSTGEQILGLGGNDTLTGHGGADSLDGGAGIDTANYSESPGAVTVNLAVGLGTGGDAQGDSLTGIENLRGSAFGDTLRGDSGANVLWGGAGNDDLRGGNGDDTLVGGSGADVLVGGNGFDTVTYQDSAAAVRVTGGTESGGDAQGDTITQVEHIIGSAFDDVLSSLNSVGVQWLEGGSGNDQLFGNGLLNGGAGNDRLIGGDSDSQVLGAIFGTGTAGLFGGAGNDVLSGGGGNDDLLGGDGNDVLAGGTGQDRLLGGAGVDSFVFNTRLPGNADVILDFNANATDKIVLDRLVDPTVFASIGSTLDSSEFRINAAGTAQDGNDYVLYSSNTGSLYYDADGNGAGAKVLVATLLGVTGTLDYTDFTTVTPPGL